MAEAVVRNARVRSEGTRNLVAAALAAGCGRCRAEHRLGLCAGCQAWREEQPLDLDAQAAAASACAAWPHWSNRCWARAWRAVLRYGQLYGPNTSRPTPRGTSPLHVEAAAWAALKALQRSPGGIFNIAEDGPEVSSEKARRELDWHAGLRLPQEALQ